MPNIRIQRPLSKLLPPHSLPKIAPIKYLEILFDDLKYDRLHRNDKLSLELNRDVKFLDELTPGEVRKMIDILREQKYGEKE